MRRQERQSAGKLGGGVDHEVDDAVAAVRQKPFQDFPVLGVGFDAVHVGPVGFHFVEGNGVDLITQIGKQRNQIAAHRAGGAENEDFAGSVHVAFLLREVTGC